MYTPSEGGEGMACCSQIGFPFLIKNLFRKIRNKKKWPDILSEFCLFRWNKRQAEFHFEAFRKTEKESEFYEESWQYNFVSIKQKNAKFCQESVCKTKKEW